MKKLSFIMVVCVLFVFVGSSLIFSQVTEQNNGPTKEETVEYIKTLLHKQGAVNGHFVINKIEPTYEFQYKFFMNDDSTCKITRSYTYYDSEINKDRETIDTIEFDMKEITEILISKKEYSYYIVKKANGDDEKRICPFIFIVGRNSFSSSRGNVEGTCKDIILFCGNDIDQIHKAFLHLWGMYKTKKLF